MYMPTSTKTFDGKRYTLVTVLDPKSKADKRADEIRAKGKLARVVKIKKAAKGEAGYTRTRYAVYGRG